MVHGAVAACRLDTPEVSDKEAARLNAIAVGPSSVAFMMAGLDWLILEESDDKADLKLFTEITGPFLAQLRESTLSRHQLNGLTF